MKKIKNEHQRGDKRKQTGSEEDRRKEIENIGETNREVNKEKERRAVD